MKVHIHPRPLLHPRHRFKLKPWQEKLQELELTFANWLNTPNVNREQGLEDVTELMTTLYPGNYTVKEVFDPDVGIVKFRLVFDCPKQELLWLLKWS